MNRRKKRQKPRQDAFKRGTLRYNDEIPVLAMIPMRVTHNRNQKGILWLPTEATATYAKQVARNSAWDVALSDIAFYHGGRRDQGRKPYRWSLLEDSARGILNQITMEVTCPPNT